ncbi:MAG: hypothetical protein GY795_13865 [Desulfobacterales bacterium]|nr:hypothetical protein [Desulfobacterales bacterium]
MIEKTTAVVIGMMMGFFINTLYTLIPILIRLQKKQIKLSQLIILWILPLKDRDEVLGDLEEGYNREAELSGHRAASQWYWSQTIRSARFFLRQRFSDFVKIILKIVPF